MQNKIIAALVIIIIALCLDRACSRSQPVPASTPKLTRTRNSAGQETVTRPAPVPGAVEAPLQKVVTKKTKTAAAVKIETVAEVKAPAVRKQDTITSCYEDKWLTVETEVVGDTVQNRVRVRNELQIWQEGDSVMVKNLNPYTTTQEFNVFVPKQRKRLPVWVKILIGGLAVKGAYSIFAK